MSRNVAKTSGAIEGRRLGDAALFFSENRVIGIAPPIPDAVGIW